jgi:ADP-heptose:LPS heptosyltransferase
VATPYKDGRWGVKGNQLKLFNIMPEQHPQQYSRPISELYLDIALILGYRPRRSYPYPLPLFAKPAHLKRSYMVLNPCGSRSTMRLRNSDLVTIAQDAARLNPALEIVVPTIAENYERYRSLFNNTTNVSVMAPSPTIIPILALVQHSKLVVTPDTALVHIACAYSVKLIAVYTSDQTLFQQWKPLNRAKTHIIRSTESKGLKGYKSLELLQHVKSIIMNLNERPQVGHNPKPEDLTFKEPLPP